MTASKYLHYSVGLLVERLDAGDEERAESDEATAAAEQDRRTGHPQPQPHPGATPFDGCGSERRLHSRARGYR